MTAHRGFTLIELMIAVAILAIVSAIAVPAYNNYVREGRLGAMRQNLDTLRIAVEDFRLENAAGTYGTVRTYDKALILSSIGWRPDGDANRYDYGLQVTSATSYNAWAIDTAARVWLRCDNRLNRCCDGTGTTTSACP
jgi:prepilin-type N-terminal cleavage/methylation domain-containing protein